MENTSVFGAIIIGTGPAGLTAAFGLKAQACGNYRNKIIPGRVGPDLVGFPFLGKPKDE